MRYLQKFINIIAIIIMTFVLIVVFFVPMFMKGTKYAGLKTYFTINLCPNLFLLLVGIVIVAVIFVVSKKSSKDFSYKLCMTVLLLVVILVQAIYFCNVNFLAGNDTLNLACGAKLRALGQYHEFYNTQYYQSCPNNLYPYDIFCLAYKVAKGIGCDGYALMQIITIIIADISLLLLADIIKGTIASERIAFAASVLFALLYCLSPWVLIPYTDQLSVVIPLLTLWIYIKIRDKNINAFLKTFLIAIIPLVTYKIKALNIIILIAIALVELVRKHNEICWKKILFNVLALALCLGILIGLTKLVEVATDYYSDSRRELGLEWYVLLGSSYTSFGQWDASDYNLIAATEMSHSQRQELAYERAGSRYKKMGAIGLAKHWANKTNMFFNDGIFLFGQCHGSIEETHETENPIGQFLSNAFFPDEDHGKYYDYYAGFMQFIWLLILVPFAVMVYMGDYRDPKVLIIKVTFIGLWLFFMLFECSPRLIISYLPIFVCGAGIGYKYIFEKISQYLNKRKVNDRQ